MALHAQQADTATNKQASAAAKAQVLILEAAWTPPCQKYVCPGPFAV
jgi:hypothetical protein